MIDYFEIATTLLTYNYPDNISMSDDNNPNSPFYDDSEDDEDDEDDEDRCMCGNNGGGDCDYCLIRARRDKNELPNRT